MRFNRQHHPTEPIAWRRPSRSDGLVAEIEDYLAGHSAERFAAAGERIPPWAVVNSLAHAEPAWLRRVVEDPTCRHPTSPAATLAWLASLILAQGDERWVRQLQRGILVPLELGLLDAESAGRLTDSQLEALVVAVLEQWNASCGGSSD